MSIALMKDQPHKPALSQALPWLVMGLTLAALAGYVSYDLGVRTHSASRAAVDGPRADAMPAPEPAARPAATPLKCTLPEDKLKAARIAIEPAREDRIPTDVGFTGQIQANADKRVDIYPRASGKVREVFVVQQQLVKRGQLLITLDSPELGTARLNLRNKQRELATAHFESVWKNEIASNVSALIPELRQALSQRRIAMPDDEEHSEISPSGGRPPADEIPKGTDTRVIEKKFADKQLGAYRGVLLQAYAEFDIASHEEQKTRKLKTERILGEHPALVARHTREGLQAKLEAAIEQVRYDAAQEKRLADLHLRQAEAAVIDAAQRLRILGVSEDIPSLLARPEQAAKLDPNEDVTYYPITAPFDGTIIKRLAVPSQKADLNDILFTLADLRTVWVTANVSESDMGRLIQMPHGTVRFTAKAYPDREFAAKLLSVAELFDPNTRMVPLRAEADNTQGLFKLGMFVWVVLDSDAREPALTVPAGAVVEIEGQKYVFIPASKEQGSATFLLRPVEVGRRWLDRVVIRSGLKKGEQVVSAGAFVLKSELILQHQGDEEE
jgi:RND family efflux transporter MFP subunit